MKKRYVLAILFISFISNNFSFAQTTKAEAIYKVKLQLKENTDKKKLSKRTKMVLEEVQNINIQFLYNEGKGSFKALEDLELDYLTKLNRSSAKTFSGTRDHYYYNVPENRVVTDREIWGTSYNIVYKLNHFEWELYNETRKIDKYLCYKATTTYSYKNRKGTITNLDVTAWYTPQIPIPLGPKNYAGLPGLILELQEGPRTIYVTELTLNPERKIRVDEVPEGKEVTEAAFEEIAAKAYGNFMDTMKKN